MAETEQVKVTALVEKLAGWCLQQPEYPYLFLAGRARRRRAARIIAYRLMTLPAVPPQDWNRQEYRTATKSLKRNFGKRMAVVKASRVRTLAKAERDRKRYARLSQERMMHLAERAFDEGGTE